MKRHQLSVFLSPSVVLALLLLFSPHIKASPLSSAAVDSLKFKTSTPGISGWADLRTNYVLVGVFNERCTENSECHSIRERFYKVLALANNRSEKEKNHFPLKFMIFNSETSQHEVIQAIATPTDISAWYSSLGPQEKRVSDFVVLINPVTVPIKLFHSEGWEPEDVLTTLNGANSWWRKFFILSTLFALPGLVLLFFVRRLKLA